MFTKHPRPTVSGFSAQRRTVSLSLSLPLSLLSDVISAASILIELSVAIPTMQTGRFLVLRIVWLGGHSSPESTHCYKKPSVTQHNFSHTL